ncbi:ATP-binding protein [Pelosinus sp. sgz500959]|uniref:sensor histidine kinase n=1 Tax=Pelosinus sp. sgz500959 TaxID=3242472 RepID=UPI00367250C4
MQNLTNYVEKEVLNLQKLQDTRLWVRWLILFFALFVSIGVTSYYFATHYRNIITQEREILGGVVKRLDLNLNARLMALQFLASDVNQKKFDPKEMNKDLMRSVEILKFFNARIFDRDGKIIAEAWRSLNSVEVHDWESFNQVLVGNPIISDVIVSEQYQRPYVSLRVPVYSTNDHIEAVLAGGILLDDLKKLVEIEKIPVGHYIFIKDNNDRVVYYPDSGEGIVQSRFMRDMQIDFRQKSSGMIVDKSIDDEEDLIYIYDKLETSNWHIVMVVPLNQLYSAAFWHSGYYFATLCLVLLCAGLLYRDLKQTRYFEENIQRLRIERLMSVNQLAAGLAHEVRNPLTAIKGFMQLIARKMDQTPNPDHVEIILNEIDGIDHLLSEFQLLTLPLKTPNFIKIDVEQMINHVMILMKGQAASKNIILTFHTNKDGFISDYVDIMDGVTHYRKDYVLGDLTQLKQVLINLLKNAIDAVDSNGTVDISLSIRDKMTWITVKDNGIGMSGDVLANIGTPFFTTKESGNGVGLSVCYNIIESHGGRIEVNSEVGKGATFFVILPCVMYPTLAQNDKKASSSKTY